ncbi:Bifunctional hemolysin/adenylate cyclase [Sulfitobacter indolifex]|uniref:Hemolysin-type calcium-binding protein n=2 Tax=Sulfitobacter indolifex TaxID=225422 RepID=A0ABM9X811_9RHOB|nr:Hemolysin-type calcium-binding protein [Sulfitobacter indolifex HEL-45]UOA19837.1 Bifunctional hemolysin/adenylate cyclase [Sulfitobacter indolifex]
MGYQFTVYDWSMFKTPSDLSEANLTGDVQANDSAARHYDASKPSWVNQDFKFEGGDGTNIVINDDDSHFEDGYVEEGGAQTLAQPATINGVTYPAGAVLENEFSLIDASGKEVYVLRIDGQNVGFVYPAEEQPKAGESFSATSSRNGDAMDSADGESSSVRYAETDTRPGVVDGTSGNDSMDAHYTDADGDSIDDGRGGGAEGNDDVVYGGDGTDKIDAGAGNDTVFGEEGRDYIRGGAGDDSLQGGGGSDTLVGGDGADTLEGGACNDVLNGGAGNDVLDGGSGDDHLWDGAGDDYADGGAGDDIFYMGAGSDTLHGGTGRDSFVASDGFGSDTVDGGSGDGDHDYIDFRGHGQSVEVTFTGFEQGTASAGRDQITFTDIEAFFLSGQSDQLDGSANSGDLGVSAGDGDDTVLGGSGDDYLLGEGGNDQLAGGEGNDTIYGGLGDDTIDGGAGNDLLDGEEGHDSISGGDGADLIYGGAGDDTLQGGADGDTLYGGDGADVIDGGTGNDLIYGDAGDDSLEGGAGDDTVYGGIGNDTIDGGAENDLLDGGAGNDLLYGGAGDDQLEGGGGDDIVHGGAGADVISGGAGNDKLFGDAGSDRISGGEGNDYVDGGYGDDYLSGDGRGAGGGHDTLVGGAGNDTLDGGAGNDQLIGGDGNDLFRVSEGHDTVSDFGFGNTGRTGDGDSSNNDVLDLGAYYDSLDELRADQADDGILNQSNTHDDEGNAVDYTDNTRFQDSSLTVKNATGDSYTYDNTGIVCFAAGTEVMTPQGPVAIETLKPGDLVETLDHGPQPLLWIGQRHVNDGELTANEELRPIRIAKGALGNHRAMFVSRQHGMMIGSDHLVRAIHLARDMPGVRIAHGKREVTYVHLFFAQHEIIFAEGIPSESFYPGRTALRMLSPEARATFDRLMPALANAETAGQGDPAETAYGPTARPFAKLCDVPLPTLAA